MLEVRIGAAWVLALALAGGDARAADFLCPSPSGEPSRDEAEARRMFHEALAIEAGDPHGALEQLRCAQQHADKPAVALRRATVEERLGNKAEAIASFEHYLDLAGEEAPDREQLRARIEALRGEAPPDEGPPSEPEPVEEGDRNAFVAGWVLTGAGVALAVAGAVFLGVAKQQSDEVHGIEPGTQAWTPDAQHTFEAAQRNQVIGIVGLAVGGAAAVGGVVLSVTMRPRPGDPPVTARLSPAGLVLSGRFD
jgi:hypothetical protein